MVGKKILKGGAILLIIAVSIVLLIYVLRYFQIDVLEMVGIKQEAGPETGILYETDENSLGLFLEEKEAPTKLPKVSVSYSFINSGDSEFHDYVMNGVMAGSVGESKQINGIKIFVEGNKKLGIEYASYCQGYGWLDWIDNNQISGVVDEDKRIESIRIRLTGADKDKYSVYYRVHVQEFGWLAWARNGEVTGTSGLKRRVEGLQIIVRDNNETGPGLNCANVKISDGIYTDKKYIDGDVHTKYQTYIERAGWMKETRDGVAAGIVIEDQKITGLRVNIENCPYQGTIKYRIHAQDIGWMDWKKGGNDAEVIGKGKRIEAIQIQLDGEIASKYDVYYRVCTPDWGWLGWAKNGETAGTEGVSMRITAIQILVQQKWIDAPDIVDGVQSNRNKASYDAM